jgi:hypothetical protein
MWRVFFSSSAHSEVCYPFTFPPPSRLLFLSFFISAPVGGFNHRPHLSPFLVEGSVVVNGVGSVNSNLFSSWSVGYSYNTENFVINYNAADNTSAALARLTSGSVAYVITDGLVEPSTLPSNTLQVPVTGSALVMAVNLGSGINASNLVPTPYPKHASALLSPQPLCGHPVHLRRKRGQMIGPLKGKQGSEIVARRFPCLRKKRHSNYRF